MTLAVWFGRTLGVRIAAAVLALAAVLQLTDLFEMAPRLLDEGRGAGGLGVYALLRAPDLLVQAAPVGVLAGTLFGFGRLARDHAVTTLRAAGVSAYRLVVLALPVAAVAAGAVFILSDAVAPRTEAALAAWLDRGAAPATEPVRRSFRLGDDVVAASPGDTAGRRLVSVELYGRGPDGGLVRRVNAREAVRGADGRWRLRDAAWENYGPPQVSAGYAAELAWTDRLDSADVRALWRTDAPTPPDAARRALNGGAAPLPLSSYRTQLDRLWAAPAGVLVMLLIAAPVALGQSRDGGVVRMSLASLAAGLGFLVADGVLSALGSAGILPAVLAAWSAAVLFAAGSAVALLNLEG